MANKATFTFNVFLLIAGILSCHTGLTQLQNTNVLNEPPDISKDFQNYKNTYFLADELTTFHPETGSGTVKYLRHNFETRQAFNNMLSKLIPAEANEFPTTEYAASPELPFSIQFISDRTIRIQLSSGPQFQENESSLMLVGGKAKPDKTSWTYKKVNNGHQYSSSKGKVLISEKP